MSLSYTLTHFFTHSAVKQNDTNRARVHYVSARKVKEPTLARMIMDHDSERFLPWLIYLFSYLPELSSYSRGQNKPSVCLRFSHHEKLNLNSLQ